MVRTVSMKGRLPQEQKILEVTELVREDLLILKEGGRGVNSVARFRESHHRLARLVASGLRTQEVLALSGYSYQRFRTFNMDPAFQELVETYKKMVVDEFKEEQHDFETVARSNMLRAEMMLKDKLDRADELDELPTIRDLALIVGDRADRLGHGKKSTLTNVNVDFAKMLEAAIDRSDNGLPKPKVIEHVPLAPAARVRAEGQELTRAPQALAGPLPPAPRPTKATMVPPPVRPLASVLSPRAGIKPEETFIRRRI